MDNRGSVPTLAERMKKLFLLRKEAEELKLPVFDSTPLHDAVTEGNIDQVTALLDAGADVNPTTGAGIPRFTPRFRSPVRVRRARRCGP